MCHLMFYVVWVDGLHIPVHILIIIVIIIRMIFVIFFQFDKEQIIFIYKRNVKWFYFCVSLLQNRQCASNFPFVTLRSHITIAWIFFFNILYIESC